MRALLTALLLPAAAAAQDVLPVPYDDLHRRLARVETFEEFPRMLSPGTRLDGVQALSGLSAAERFSGQIIAQQQGFDTILGQPVPPLSLAAGAERQNLAVTFYFMLSNHLVGHAAPGHPDRGADGEGAIAILFDDDQKALGFRVAAEPDGDAKGLMMLSFYARNGRLIDRLEVPLDWGRQGYGFERAGGEADIAGVTIENRDPAGIAIDDVIFDVTLPSS